jgi:hypothetical protein
MLRERCPRGSTRRTIEAVQRVRVSAALRNGVNRPSVVSSPVGRSPVQDSVGALNQSREWFSAIGIRVEVVEIGIGSSRTHLKDDAVAIQSAVDGCAVEIAVAGLRQWGIRFGAASTVKAMQESYRARGRDLVDCTQIRIRYPSQNQSCAIEVSIGPENQWGKCLATVGSVEVIKSLERSPGSNAVDGAAFRRSPVFGSSVESAVRALDRRSPWALAVGPDPERSRRVT